MFEFYLPIKWVHVTSVLLSGSLFFVRGLGVIAGQHWPLRPWLRYTSYTIDTVLLTAASMLVAILPRAMFANGWLTVKLTLLVCYIVLGILALKRARSPRLRVLSFAAALLVFASMLAIARQHDPWAPLRWMMSTGGSG